MQLPGLENFEANIHQVHRAIMLFGVINHQTLEKQQNWLHMAMQSQADGFVTQTYPKGGRLVLNTEKGLVLYQRPSGGQVPFLLKIHTQKSLFEGILSAMEEDELAGYFDDLPGDSLPEKLLGKIHAKNLGKLPEILAEHTREEKLAYDIPAIQDYMQALNTIYTGIARWRGRIRGHLSPIVVWAEHFDLSTIIFETPEMDEYKSHINIGFAPFTEGVFERPYLYAYAYPYKETYDVPELDTPLKWETEAYTGIYVAYDALVGQDEFYIEALAEQIFTAMQSVLGSV